MRARSAFSEAFDKVAKILFLEYMKIFITKGKKRKERKIKFRYINLNIKQGDIKMKSKPPDYSKNKYLMAECQPSVAGGLGSDFFF